MSGTAGDVDAMSPSDLLRRLLAKDTTLWTADAEVSALIEQRLGWIDAVSFSLTQTHRLAQFRDRAGAEGFDRAILLGMGGSSLAPEVFAQCFRPANGIGLTVLDTTFPDTVQQVSVEAERGKPLFIVSSKSGTTAETTALGSHFWHWAQARYGDTANNHFIAITDEHSSLHRLAREFDYREIFLNPADIGGRYSALSLFGLVPACLLGIDVERLLRNARSVFSAGPQAEQALRLGRFMGHAYIHGRDKLTLTFSPRLKPLGAWIEQLVAESTGKEGKGIVPIIDEPVEAPGQYGSDRLFVDTSLPDEADDDQPRHRWRQGLEQLGHPVFTEQMEDIYELGVEFAKWQIATAIAAAVIGVNPFDEPDVNATKAATSRLLQQPAAGPARSEVTTADQQISSLRRFLNQSSSATDYMAILAYLPADSAYINALNKLRRGIARRTNRASCVALGPRYLHSSGQLHKGGPKNGHFIVLTAAAKEDVAIPSQSYGFKHLIDAQASGDMDVLRQRGQQVLHIELGSVATACPAISNLADQLTA